MSLLFGRRGVGVVRLATRTTTTVPLAAVQGSDAHGLFPGASQTAAAHTGITICSSSRHTTSAGLHPSSNPSGLFRAGPRLEAYPRSNRPMNTSRRVVRSASTSGTERLTEFDHEAFSSAFLQEIHNVENATDPAQSSAILRRLVKSGLLKYTDMRDAPEKFFLGHRLLSTVGLGGFGIRFTVQYNLFAGSILGLAGPEQISMLGPLQEEGLLGCFLLTEMQAGVLSGLIVETTATWNSATKTFDLHTPSDKAAKNWISQGFTAERGVVIADLIVNGKSHGPHPFFMELRDPSTLDLLTGIRIDDMGTKTVANDLDNARVWFDHVQLPKSALLNKFCEISDDDTYTQVGDQAMRIEVIGQRLLTGRLVIAQAAVVAARVLHMKTEEYARQKVCNGLDGEVSLASMPQLRTVFAESYAELDEMIRFSAAVERRLSQCLSDGSIPDNDLIDAISVCKIRCIDAASQRVYALRQEVGSYALMGGTGFELNDMFLCTKFAEGDTRILQQKLTRDRLKALKDGGLAATLLVALNPLSSDGAEARAALLLARKLAPAGRDRTKMAAKMDKHWRDIYALADMIADRHVREQKGIDFPEPIVERIKAFSPKFDFNWKDTTMNRSLKDVPK